ncbi:hypothetical protein CYFUS_000585 [Cystobacter fuscus]|uniref:DUF4184 family protein n=1 Tax=Cystobacter fuscus TaxID=43 RepID=A0A250IVA0_9BACT|nr:DUF4184 family protein [Cystobacter fuscus]ATB35173.1 hypothetical protein CYFUS_000585 [Cystobacter fuscus]
MPVTLPAHAAAVLPFFRFVSSHWVRTALVVGACSPDFSYIYVPHGWGRVAHTVPGLFQYCLPVGLGVLVWLQVLVLPALRRALPEVAGVQWGRFVRLESPPRTLLAWAVVLGALLVGAATHLLWDGFTHRDMWPANVLYRGIYVPVGSRELSLSRVFQHLSSVVGSLGVLGYMVRRYRHLEPVPGGSWAAFLRLLLPTLAGACAGLAWRLSRPESMGALEAQVWWVFWPTVTGALVGFTLGCALVRWYEGRGAARLSAPR